MNPEIKKEAGTITRVKFRILVRGDTEPAEWTQGWTDSPTVGKDAVRMLVHSADKGTPDDPDCISSFDVDTAFSQGQKYGPDDRPRYVALRMYKGAALRVFRMAGSLYGQTDASIRFYRSLKTCSAGG